MRDHTETTPRESVAIAIIWWSAIVLVLALIIATAVVNAQPAQAPLPALYDRSDWRHWIDADGDCVDTRHEVLFEEAVATGATNRNGCRVLSGEWLDPYTGETLTLSADLDIDHMVPLAWAHDHGAAGWSPDMKRDFANDLADPDHLVAVRARENRQKGARGPDEWVPPNTDAWCWYGTAWARITAAWGLEVDGRTAQAIVALVATCAPVDVR